MDLEMRGGKYTKGKNREIGMKLDATEVKKVETSKPKEVDANAVLSNAAPAVSFFTGSCSPDSAGNNLFVLFGW